MAARRRGPSPGKTAATRRALLDAAMASFLERGYANTRMSDVAARAGVAKGTTYLHFADKKALFAAALRSVMQNTHGGAQAPRPRFGEPTAAFLRRLLPPVLRTLQQNGLIGLPRLIAAEGPRFPELAQVYHEVAIAPVLRLARLYARRAESRGELRGKGLSDMPILLAAPVITATLWNGLFASDEQLDVATVFETWIDLTFVQ